MILDLPQKKHRWEKGWEDVTDNEDGAAESNELVFSGAGDRCSRGFFYMILFIFVYVWISPLSTIKSKKKTN